MKIVKWIVQILLIIAFFGAGVMKLISPYVELIVQEGMAWAGDFSAMTIKVIGALEVLGALGLFLPVLLNKFKMLVPMAAVGLGLVMIGAMITHIGRGESFFPNIVLLLLAVATAYFRKDYFKS